MVGAGVVLLLVVSSTPPSVEAVGEPPPIAEQRGRVRGSLAFAPAVALLSWEDAPVLGVGGIFEAGLIFNDRLALSLHFEGLLVPDFNPDLKPRALFLRAGPTLDWFLDDRWSLGIGVLGGLPIGGQFTAELMLPLRASWHLTPRDAKTRGRSSLMIGLQAGPGLEFGYVDVGLVGSAMLIVGFGLW